MIHVQQLWRNGRRQRYLVALLDLVRIKVAKLVLGKCAIVIICVARWHRGSIQLCHLCTHVRLTWHIWRLPLLLKLVTQSKVNKQGVTVIGGKFVLFLATVVLWWQVIVDRRR